MSIKLMSQVWECQFTKAEQSVMLAMADHAKDDGSDCYPSVDLIAWKTDYSDRQVRRVIKDLCRRGVLVKVRGAGRGRGVEYRIDLSKAEPKLPYTPKRGDTMSPYSQKPDTVSPQRKKYDTMSPQREKPDTMSPQNGHKGGHSEREKVTFDAQKGDIAMSAKPITNNHVNGISPSDPWMVCLDELKPQLTSVSESYLAGSRMEPAGERDGKPLYRIIVEARAAAGIDWLVAQAGPAIRRKVSSVLGRPVAIEIVADAIEPERTPSP